MEPVPIEDHEIEAVLVDFSIDVVVHLTAVTSPEDLLGVLAFDVADLSAVPTPSALVSSALSWSLDMAGGVPDRTQYHSADEVPEILAGGTKKAPSNQPLSPPGPRRRAPSGPTPKGANAWLHLAKAVGKLFALRQPLASSAFPGSLPAASLQDLLREMPTRRGAAHLQSIRRNKDFLKGRPKRS